jgi:hypothetical protein
MPSAVWIKSLYELDADNGMTTMGFFAGVYRRDLVREMIGEDAYQNALQRGVFVECEDEYASDPLMPMVIERGRDARTTR